MTVIDTASVECWMIIPYLILKSYLFIYSETFLFPYFFNMSLNSRIFFLYCYFLTTVCGTDLKSWQEISNEVTSVWRELTTRCLNLRQVHCQTTNGVKVTVIPFYIGKDPDKGKNYWGLVKGRGRGSGFAIVRGKSRRANRDT